MKYYLSTIFLLCLSFLVCAQEELVVSPSNGTATSLEKNLLFYADKRFSVSQSGSVSLPLSYFFDGNMMPLYTSTGINPDDPYVITIDGIPNYHSQRGAWLGWSTRYYAPKRFKIEIFDWITNSWSTLINHTQYDKHYFIIPIPHTSIRTIKMTIYETDGPQNLLGLSEIFYLHPEATQAYDHLLLKYNHENNVGIGTMDPEHKLDVVGKIRAHEIMVNTQKTADYVFEEDYALRSLDSLAAFIKEKKHLPEILSAKEMEKTNMEVGSFQIDLLKKIEELTLYIIDLQGQIKNLENRLK